MEGGVAFRGGGANTVQMGRERLILIPGMGADERLFDVQREAGIEFECPPFPIPESDDDIASYAARIAKGLKVSNGCILGGVSFGGMVACELARILRPRAVLLIASCRTGTGFPGYLTPLEWVSRLIPDVLIEKRCEASSRMMAQMENLTEEQYCLIRDMSLDTPVVFLRRVARMILQWEGSEKLPCPVHQIHGGRDHIIPLKQVQADAVIPDGGHLINLTHAEQVNAFIRRHVDQRTEARTSRS
jgi:pimeloyl-ACP methyl ester carboxylesterase